MLEVGAREDLVCVILCFVEEVWCEPHTIVNINHRAGNYLTSNCHL